MNDRAGENLWSEWDGDLYENFSNSSIIYYTFEHVDVDNEIVKRALASALQRDGIADSLSDAFKLVERSNTVYGWCGHQDEEIFLTFCDESGETYYGDIIFEIIPTTFVEII